MTLRKNLKPLNAPSPRQRVQFDIAPAAIEHFRSGLRMEDTGAASDNVLPIMGVIGSDFWSDGVTPKSVQNRLKEIGAQDVVVHLNSPGGDFFDGQAIFNILQQHPHDVTVKILGIAASAASVIAMAGDSILMPKASWMMIHNTWVVAMGDRNALNSIAEDLAKFDQVSAQLYADRTGMKLAEVAKMMDADTFMSGEDAVKKGFADMILNAAKVVEDAAGDAAQSGARTLELIFQRAGLARGERRAMLKQFLPSLPGADGTAGKPGAAAGVSQDALNELDEGLASLRQVLKT